jgi:hypothetical protein
MLKTSSYTDLCYFLRNFGICTHCARSKLTRKQDDLDGISLRVMQPDLLENKFASSMWKR